MIFERSLMYSLYAPYSIYFRMVVRTARGVRIPSRGQRLCPAVHPLHAGSESESGSDCIQIMAVRTIEGLYQDPQSGSSMFQRSLPKRSLGIC